MLKTKAGLPNTCSNCGKQVVEWYAPSIDMARSGNGLCEKCAFPEPPAQPARKTRTTRRKPTAAKPVAKQTGKEKQAEPAGPSDN